MLPFLCVSSLSRFRNIPVGENSVCRSVGKYPGSRRRSGLGLAGLGVRVAHARR